jgi:hypothetical protein
LRLPAFLLPALRVPFALATADLVSDGLVLILSDVMVQTFQLTSKMMPFGSLNLRSKCRVAEIEEEFPAGPLDPFLLLLEVVALEDEWWIPTYSSRCENNTESLLGMLFSAAPRGGPVGARVMINLRRISNIISDEIVRSEDAKAKFLIASSTRDRAAWSQDRVLQDA